MIARKVLILVGILAVVAAAAATWWLRRDTTMVVTTEVVRTRDLEATVSASGKIQPKRLVNISADTSGRVVDLAVAEGQRVARGEFLLQIDPRSLRTRVDSGAASLRAAEAALEQMRQGIETARVQLVQAEQNLRRQRDLWQKQLTTRETLDKIETEVQVAQSTLSEREKQVAAQAARLDQERAGLEAARYDLSKVRIESPIDGIVTRRNIQEGETAVIGTMNNAGTVLLTLADMSVIQAEVEVDETSIPQVQIGQQATVTIDALPDRTFTGRVTEIGNSPIQTATGQTQTGTQATNFKVAIVLDQEIPDVRPGFTCAADITTAVRRNVAAVPIPAVAVRELVYDASGQVVPQPRNTREGSVVSPIDLAPGQTRKEVDGVFVVRSGVVAFTPVHLGIAGDRFFEVASGLQPGDEVVTGPYDSVRNMADGDEVTVERQGG